MTFYFALVDHQYLLKAWINLSNSAHMVWLTAICRGVYCNGKAKEGFFIQVISKWQLLSHIRLFHNYILPAISPLPPALFDLIVDWVALKKPSAYSAVRTAPIQSFWETTIAAVAVIPSFLLDRLSSEEVQLFLEIIFFIN